MTSENSTNPRTTRDALDELNTSDPECRECADLGSLAGSGMFCWACGQGDR
jgi:hypothetical protein